MGKKGVNSRFLPYELHYLPEFLEVKARDELGENAKIKGDLLIKLKSLLKDQNYPGLLDEDEFLLAFLYARKFNVERAFRTLLNFCASTRRHQDVYYNFHFDDVTRVLQSNVFGYLERRDSQGCVVFVVKLGNWNPLENTHCDILRAQTCAFLDAVRSRATQVAGFKAIVDYAGYDFRYLRHTSLRYARLTLQLLQGCIPGRFVSIHIVNENSIFHYLWNLMKPLVSKKLRERLHLHGKDLESLQEYIPVEILPEEYGGENGPFDCSHCAKEIEKHSQEICRIFTHIFYDK